MLKTAFLVTFLGLLVQMAQAVEMPLNQIPAAVCSDVFNEHVAESISPNDLVPMPKTRITDPGTGAEYTNLKAKGTPKVRCQVKTKDSGYFYVTVTGSATIEGDVTGSTSAVPCKVETLVSAPFEIKTTPMGDLKCGATPSTDQATVSCKSNPETSGGLLSVIRALLNILTSLLNVLNTTLRNVINSLLPNILTTVKNTLDSSLKRLTDPIPMGNYTCKYKVMDVKTDANGYMKMVVQQNKYADGGTPKPTPVGTYDAPELKPERDSACVFALHERLISTALEDYTQKPFEIIGGDGLIALSQTIKQLCGKDIDIVKLVFKPSGSPQVKITENNVSCKLTGMFEVYARGSDLPFQEASGYLAFTGQFGFSGTCITIMLTFDGVGEVKFVRGQPSCDLSYQASQTFTAELRGKASITECIAVSPIAHLPPKGKTMCTPKASYLLVEQKKY
ncbi:uncharacterized protein [Pleurodeles waltl]